MFYLCSRTPPAPATSEMLAEMSACAHRLGVGFAAEAERTQDFGRRLEMFQLFDRCFFAVRVATALQLRLRRESGWARAREPAGEAEAEVLDGPESPERERPEAAEPERERFEADRDRETERASLPVFLKTLQGVAAEAAALPGPRPAELPRLQDLLARATAAPEPARPAPRAPLRERLAGGSAAVAVATAPRPPASPLPFLPGRRATGPPRR